MTCHSRPLQPHERVTCVAEAQCDKGLPADRHKPLRLEWLLLMEHHYVESSRHIVSIRTRVFFRRAAPQRVDAIFQPQFVLVTRRCGRCSPSRNDSRNGLLGKMVHFVTDLRAFGLIAFFCTHMTIYVYFAFLACYVHTTTKAPDPIRTRKLNVVGLD